MHTLYQGINNSNIPLIVDLHIKTQEQFYNHKVSVFVSFAIYKVCLSFYFFFFFFFFFVCVCGDRGWDGSFYKSYRIQPLSLNRYTYECTCMLKVYFLVI